MTRGVLLAEKHTRAYSIWVYENVVVKTMGARTIEWVPDLGCPAFVFMNSFRNEHIKVPATHPAMIRGCVVDRVLHKEGRAAALKAWAEMLKGDE